MMIMLTTIDQLTKARRRKAENISGKDQVNRHDLIVNNKGIILIQIQLVINMSSLLHINKLNISISSCLAVS